METIEAYKEKLRELEKEVLTKSNEKEHYHLTPEKILLVTVEENIALWEKWNSTSDYSYFFYTNLNGKLLFKGKTFQYATPFSNSLACVEQNNEWFILDRRKKEITVFPPDITFENLNSFRNNNLALFDKSKWHWGSIKYNSEENSFEDGIPFIWDGLEFSREKNQIYVGLHDLKSINSNHPYDHGEKIGDLFIIQATKMQIEKAKTTDYYNELIDEYKYSFFQNKFASIKIEIPSLTKQDDLKNIIRDYLIKTYNISDFYFGEKYKKEFNNNDGTIIDLDTFDDYQRILGKRKNN